MICFYAFIIANEQYKKSREVTGRTKSILKSHFHFIKCKNKDLTSVKLENEISQQFKAVENRTAVYYITATASS